ncbi:PASTA domain-containing protein [Auraticoccus monumenti]|uniref:PASTA domain-containing protein n=1 Tax=Auraticoccus monumenti TaxID=675864 RepID=UPI0038B2CAAE
MTEVLAGRPPTALPRTPAPQEQPAGRVVPQVLGLGVEEARARLDDAGFTVVTRPVRSRRPEGEVLGATPSRRAPAGTITLSVATRRDAGRAPAGR